MDGLNNNDKIIENTNTEPQSVETKPLIEAKKPLFGERFEFWATKIVIPAASAFGMIAVVCIISWQLSNQSQQMKDDAEKARMQSELEAEQTRLQFEYRSRQMELESQKTKEQFDILSKQMEVEANKNREQFDIQSKQLDQQADIARKQIAAEQFNQAIEHLGSEKQTVVLGGVHALHNLAMNFPDEYSKQVFEVLCSFIREETSKPEYQKKVVVAIEATDETKMTSPTVITIGFAIKYIPPPEKPIAVSLIIQTIVDKLFKEKVEVTNEKTGETKELYRNHDANLSGAFLRGVNFFVTVHE